MKKLFAIVCTLAMVGSGVAFGDVQIDKGQSLSTAAKKFFIGRYGRTGAVDTAGAHEISKDSIVIWDATSNDGVSVTTSSTSNDALVAGIAMDLIIGSSRDNSAADDESYSNVWGRIQCWGRYNDARWAAHMYPVTGGTAAAGHRVGTSATAQKAGLYLEEYAATTGLDADSALNSSKDSVGVSLEATSSGKTTMDIFLDRC